MRGWIEQGAVVMLSMDFHERAAQLAQQCGRYRPVVDERLCASVFVLDASQDQNIFAVETLIAEQAPGGMGWRNVEGRRDGRGLRAFADELAVAPRAKGEAEAIENDGLARPRFSREDCQPLGKNEIELIDQDNIADRQSH